jgi:phosphoribosyl-AMP cyclohydrolase / phosphoribosyl-ATP pyrophosphohydrolase
MSCALFNRKQVLEHSRSDETLAVVQHVDTGELLMQAFADRAAISETLQTGLATFYSRSRKVRLHWR